MGIQRPGRVRLDDVTQAVEDLAQRMGALPALFRQKRQIGRNKCPFLVGNVRCMRFVAIDHPANLRNYGSSVYNSL